MADPSRRFPPSGSGPPPALPASTTSIGTGGPSGGISLPDPTGVFGSSVDGSSWSISHPGSATNLGPSGYGGQIPAAPLNRNGYLAGSMASAAAAFDVRSANSLTPGPGLRTHPLLRMTENGGSMVDLSTGLAGPPMARFSDASSAARPAIRTTLPADRTVPIVLGPGKTANMPGMIRAEPDPFIVPSYLRGSRFIQKLHYGYAAAFPDAALPVLQTYANATPDRTGIGYSEDEMDDSADSDEEIGRPTAPPMVPIRQLLFRQGGLRQRPTRAGKQTGPGGPDRPAASRPADTPMPPAREGGSGGTGGWMSPASLPLLPTRLNETERGSYVDFSADGTAATISTPPSHDGTGLVILRADRPAPRQCGMYYFEVCIAVNGTECVPHIGFSDGTISTSGLPGQTERSFGYNCATGEVMCNRARLAATARRHRDTFTVGVGINFRTGRVFVCQESARLDEFAVGGLAGGSVYPTVAIASPNGVRVKFNFGATAFVFDIDSLVSAEKRTVRAAISDTSLGCRVGMNEAELLRVIVSDHLLSAGFPATAAALVKDVLRDSRLRLDNTVSLTERSLKADNWQAVDRRTVMDAILDGRADNAIVLADQMFPSFLATRPGLRFRLRCRVFAEAVASSALTNGQPVTNGGDSCRTEGGDGSNNNDSGTPATGTTTNSTARLVALGRQLRADPAGTGDSSLARLRARTLGLLAYSDPWDSPVASELSEEGRGGLAEEVNKELLVHLGQNGESALTRLALTTDVLVSVLDTHGRAGVAVDGLRGEPEGRIEW